MTDAIQDALQALIRERGGRDRFDSTQLMIASRLVEMLVSDATVSAPAVVALVGLLPPKPDADSPAWDLSKLSDKELTDLDRIAAIATGTKPPTPEKPRKGPPKFTPRGYAALDCARLLDQIEAEQTNARKDRTPYELADGDLMAVRNGFVMLLGLVALPSQVFRAEIESAEYAVRKEFLHKQAAALAAAPIPPAAEPAPSSNVVTPAFGVFKMQPPSGRPAV